MNSDPSSSKALVSRLIMSGDTNVFTGTKMTSHPNFRTLFRAHPAINHCSHLLIKCRVATNLSNWLKVHSRWFKNHILQKVYFDRILDFSNIAFIIPSHFIIVPYLTL